MKKSEIKEKILEILSEQSDGLKAREIAKKLEIEKKQINSILYSDLSSQIYQDKSYNWYLKKPSKDIEIDVDTESKEASLTEISRLCRYYLNCLGHEEAGISTFLDSKYDLDYEELGSFPKNIDELISEEAYQRLQGRVRKDRSRKQMYLGYPTYLRNHKSKKSTWEGYFVEPVLLFSIDIDASSSITLNTKYPVINTKILSAFTNCDRDSLMDELIRLEEELGINEDTDFIEIDDLVLRLQKIRTEWPWKEEIILSDINNENKLRENPEEGIFNRPIVICSEKSPYTAGLETELNQLSKCHPDSIAGTALGTFLEGNKATINSDEYNNNRPLLEVLPLNTEQREAINSGLNEKLTIITGPPGTGKSQVVTNLLINAAWQENKKVLFASKNNAAVDVVEIRINNLATRPILLRVGSQAYQKKLAQYLLALLSTSSSADDKLEFEQAEMTHNKLLEQADKLDSDTKKLIKLRNKVDLLEREVEDIRGNYSSEEFLSFKYTDIEELQNDIKKLKLLLGSVKKVIFWTFRKNGIFRRANSKLNQTLKFLKKISISNIDNDLTEQNINRWWDLVADLEEYIENAMSSQEYFKSLTDLKNFKSLETISHEQSLIIDSIANNSEILWKLWLKIQPNNLKGEDRALLTKYQTILQMVVDTREGQRLERNIYKEYQKVSKEVSHLLPCWAVTSLSARGKISFEPGIFDIVVFDEASQCDIASALPLLFRAKKAVIIGDPKQLSHISSIKKGMDQQFLDKYNLISDFPHWSYSYQSLFGLAAGLCAPSSIINLVDHHRSHSDIIEFSNKQFYEERLRVATRYENLNQIDPNEAGIRWVNTQGNSKQSSSGGSYNPKEVDAVINELKTLVLDRGYKGTIGVVSPFRAQANAISEAVKRNNQLDSLLIQSKFISNTVHKFQGDERDIMIFSPVLSTGMTKGSLYFLKNQGNLFNVAITRARAQLIVVGDLTQCASSGIGYLSDFAVYCKDIQKKTSKKVKTYEYGNSEYPAVDNPEQVSDWEKYFYKELYKSGIKSIPQYRVEKYALDFAIINGEKKLNVEVDGERYHRNWNGELCRRDQIRNQRLYELGWDVKRFWVYEIRDDLKSCVDQIKTWMKNNN